jgi:hypothetical protein
MGTIAMYPGAKKAGTDGILPSLLQFVFTLYPHLKKRLLIISCGFPRSNATSLERASNDKAHREPDLSAIR